MRTLISIFQEVERSMKGIMSVPSYTVLLLLCLGGLSAQAATIYVRPQGNDATPCAQAQNAQTPRRTLNAGIACLSGGDTLIVGGGTYDEVIGTIGMGAPAGIPGGLSPGAAHGAAGRAWRAGGPGPGDDGRAGIRRSSRSKPIILSSTASTWMGRGTIRGG